MYIGIAYCYLKWKLFLPTHSVYHISRWGQPASIIKSFTCTLCCQFDKSNIWVHIMKQQFRSLKAHLLAKYHTKLHKDTPVYFRDLLQTSLWPILFFYFSACPLETTIVQIICKWYQINLSISCNTLPIFSNHFRSLWKNNAKTWFIGVEDLWQMFCLSQNKSYCLCIWKNAKNTHIFQAKHCILEAFILKKLQSGVKHLKSKWDSVFLNLHKFHFRSSVKYLYNFKLMKISLGRLLTLSFISFWDEYISF